MTNVSDVLKPLIEAVCASETGVASVILAGLLCVSEYMAMNNRLRGNGILHAVICALKREQCELRTPRFTPARRTLSPKDAIAEATTSLPPAAAEPVAGARSHFSQNTRTPDQPTPTTA